MYIFLHKANVETNHFGSGYFDSRHQPVIGSQLQTPTPAASSHHLQPAAASSSTQHLQTAEVASSSSQQQELGPFYKIAQPTKVPNKKP